MQNVPAVPSYVVSKCISMLMRYSIACASNHQDYINRRLLLNMELLNQRFLAVKFKSSIRRFYGSHHDCINCCGLSVSMMTMYTCSVVRGTWWYDLSPDFNTCILMTDPKQSVTQFTSGFQLSSSCSIFTYLCNKCFIDH